MTAPPIPLPRSYPDRATLRAMRKHTGYTSIRVTRRTAELLREMLSTSSAIGLDELLYFDALDRLGRPIGR